MTSPSAPTHEFHYPPLGDPSQHIRLLRHIPSASPSSLAFEMLVATENILSFSPVVQKLHYHAISYTWGSPLNPTTIHVNGSPFAVGRNAFYALWQHRLHYSDALVWMDSICMNQSDLREKGQQVAIMSEIYLAADRVVDCVGPHADGTEVLSGFFGEMAVAKEAAQKNARAKGRYHEHDKEVMREWVLGLEGGYRRWVFGAMEALAKRDYWTRLWIVQENHHARKGEILCGESVFAWSAIEGFVQDVLGHAGDCCQDEDSKLMPLDAPLEEISAGIVRSHMVMLLPVLRSSNLMDDIVELDWFRTSHCSDDRDRVFALQSMTRREQFVPDYERSVFELAVEVAGRLSTERHNYEPSMLRLRQLREVRIIVESLGLDCRSEEIRAAVKERQREMGRFDMNREVHFASREPLRVHRSKAGGQRRKGGVEVRQTESGDLTAHFCCGENDTIGLSPQDCEAHGHHKSLSMESDTTTAAAAFVCNSTQPGDILVPIDRQLFIILRRLDDEFYGVVGQGFTLGNYENCTNMECERRERHLRIGADVLLSPVDAIVLAGQDLMERGNGGVDVQARLERLNTAVSSACTVAAVQEPRFDRVVMHTQMM